MVTGQRNIVLVFMIFESSQEIYKHNSVFDDVPAAVSLMWGTRWTLDRATGAAANCSSPRCPSCHVTWRKEGDPTFHLNETLFLNPVKKTDRGNYTCTVEDSGGHQWNNGTLEILVNYPTETVSLSVKNRPYSKTHYKIEEGANISLSCAVDGFPPPLVKWHKDGGVVKTNNLTQTYGLHQNPGQSFETSYHVTDAGCEDDGTYVCQAGNGVGQNETIENYVTIEVECAPKVQGDAKQLWSVRRGDTVVVSFTVLSNPVSSVLTWWRTGGDADRESLTDGDADHSLTDGDAYHSLNDSDADHSLNETVVDGNAQHIALTHYNVTESGQYGVTLTNGHPPNLTVAYAIRVDKVVLTNQTETGSKVEDCAGTVCMFKPYIIGGCVVVAAAVIVFVVIIAVKYYRRTHDSENPLQDDSIFCVPDDIFPPMSSRDTWNKNHLQYSCNTSSSSIYRETHV